MTPFSALLKMAGLSQKEAADFFRVRHDTVRSWSIGRNPVPEGILDELHKLFTYQEEVAGQTFDLLWKNNGKPSSLEIGYAADDYEAQQLGWPCVGAQMAMIARLWEMLHGECEIKIVPRGSTVGTAAAIEAHKK